MDWRCTSNGFWIAPPPPPPRAQMFGLKISRAPPPPTHKQASCGNAAIAQLGERQTEDLKVPGTIPGLGIIFSGGGCPSNRKEMPQLLSGPRRAVSPTNRPSIHTTHEPQNHFPPPSSRRIERSHRHPSKPSCQSTGTPDSSPERLSPHRTTLSPFKTVL